MKYYKSDDIKKAFKERNRHIVNNWMRLNFKCGPQSVVTYDNDFPITLRGKYVGVECKCGKIFYDSN